MTETVRKAGSLYGTVRVPGDKSIAHRAAMLAALGDGASQIAGYPEAADPQSTLACLRALGVAMDEDDGILYVEGVGLTGLRAPDSPLDCGNAGTTMRLLAGILAGQPYSTTLTGDASLRSRPMERIATPLREMGAVLHLTGGCAPIHLTGGQKLRGITYRLPMASAQVKSCVLLAGLYATDETTVVEPTPSRDHTERMLELDVLEMGGARYLTIQPGMYIPSRMYTVPGDFSAAAFWLAAGSLVPDSEISLPGVGLNPSRSAFLDVLQAMGARITVENAREHSNEPIADLTVCSSVLHGVSIGGELIPNLIDEIPVLAVAAAFAEGQTKIRDAGELRVKETDRLAALATNLRALGARVEEHEDGLTITGRQRLRGATVESFGDHRIAMAMGVAGLVADGETTITDAECAEVSFPNFWTAMHALTLQAERS